MPEPLNHLLAQSAPALGSGASFLRSGGVFMIPLAIASVAGLMAIIYKAMSLSSARVVPPGLAREVQAFERRLAENPAAPVPREFQEGGSVLARLGAVAMKHRGRPQAEITHAVEASAREEAVHLQAGIGALDVVITVAPLLGLLGTASGLVVIFQGLGETTDYVTISRGIAEALSTTIVGLAIAVPCVVAHSYFNRRIDRFMARLETLLADLVNVCGRR